MHLPSGCVVLQHELKDYWPAFNAWLRISVTERRQINWISFHTAQPSISRCLFVQQHPTKRLLTLIRCLKSVGCNCLYITCSELVPRCVHLTNVPRHTEHQPEHLLRPLQCREHGRILSSGTMPSCCVASWLSRLCRHVTIRSGRESVIATNCPQVTVDLPILPQQEMPMLDFCRAWASSLHAGVSPPLRVLATKWNTKLRSEVTMMRGNSGETAWKPFRQWKLENMFFFDIVGVSFLDYRLCSCIQYGSGTSSPSCSHVKAHLHTVLRVKYFHTIH